MTPAIFNYVILGMFVCNAIRYGMTGNTALGLYWVGAVCMQISLTFLMENN